MLSSKIDNQEISEVQRERHIKHEKYLFIKIKYICHEKGMFFLHKCVTPNIQSYIIIITTILAITKSRRVK